jgi:hypothetical protein
LPTGDSKVCEQVETVTVVAAKAGVYDELQSKHEKNHQFAKKPIKVKRLLLENAGVDVRILVELPYHLEQLGSWEELLEWLTGRDILSAFKDLQMLTSFLPSKGELYAKGIVTRSVSLSGIELLARHWSNPHVQEAAWKKVISGDSNIAGHHGKKGGMADLLHQVYVKPAYRQLLSPWFRRKEEEVWELENEATYDSCDLDRIPGIDKGVRQLLKEQRDSASVNFYDQHKETVVVNTLDGMRLELKLRPCHSVKYIKHLIEKKTGIPWWQQELMSHNSSLNFILESTQDEMAVRHLIHSNDAEDKPQPELVVIVNNADDRRPGLGAANVWKEWNREQDRQDQERADWGASGSGTFSVPRLFSTFSDMDLVLLACSEIVSNLKHRAELHSGQQAPPGPRWQASQIKEERGQILHKMIHMSE